MNNKVNKEWLHIIEEFQRNGWTVIDDDRLVMKKGMECDDKNEQ